MCRLIVSNTNTTLTELHPETLDSTYFILRVWTIDIALPSADA